MDFIVFAFANGSFLHSGDYDLSPFGRDLLGGVIQTSKKLLSPAVTAFLFPFALESKLSTLRKKKSRHKCRLF